jgi:hypothetical protein
VRILLILARSPEANAFESRFTIPTQVRRFETIGETLHGLAQSTWRPEMVVVELQPEAMADWCLMGQLKEMTGNAPIVMGMAGARRLLEVGQEAHVPGTPSRPHDLPAVIATLVEQQRILSQSILAQRATITSELEQLSAQAAEAAAARALDRLAARLGLDDAEGLRLAVRFARGWEEAKVKFVSALTTGLASAFLLALGAGIVAVVRSSGSK